MAEKIMSSAETTMGSSALKSARRIILGMQHLIAMFGSTVLVPILTGLDPSVALVCAGIGTLMFHLVTKGMVPVFLGSSFAFIPVIITVRETYGGDLTYAQGGIMAAGLVYMIMSLLVSKFGVKRIKSYFPAQVIGPMIIVIGLNLIPVALGMYSSNFVAATVTISVALGITFFGKGFLKQLAILIAVITGYIVSMKMGIVDTSAVKEAAWIAKPNFTTPKFEIGAIAIIAPVVLAVFMEHIGDITTNGVVVGKNFIENPGLNRTLMGDGVATLIAGFLGGPANTTYGENTGVLAITKNYDPSIIRITAVFAIMLGCVSKMGKFLQSIPVPVMGGISLMLFSMIAFIGFKTLKDSKIEYNASNIIVMATIIFIGLGAGYIEKHFGITIGISVTESVKITGLSLAAIVGVVLNKVLNRKEQA